MNALRWILSLILAGLFFFMAFNKFLPEISDGPNLVFPIIAKNVGIPLIEPYFRWITGGVEALVGLLLIAPKTRIAGALLGLCVLIGALVSHLTPILGMEVGGSHFVFYLAIAMFVLSLIVAFLSRSRHHDVDVHHTQGDMRN